MTSSNPGPSMTGETYQQQDVSLHTRNLDSVREPSDASDSDGLTSFNSFYFYDRDLKGKGSFGLVFEGTFRINNQKVAIKRIQKAEAKVAIKDHAVLFTTSHQNIVKYFQIEQDRYFYYIVLELCQASLDTMVNRKVINNFSIKVKLSNIKVKLLHEIAFGLDHLHSSGIFHRDLKPSKILIKKNGDEITPKIADFGISRIMAPGKDHYTATDGGLGTHIWCPPEVLDSSNRHITTAIDIFAYGRIVHYVMCPGSHLRLRHPFGVLKDGYGGDSIIRAIKAGNRKLYISTIDHKKPNATDKANKMFADILIQDLTNVNRKDRPSIKHVLNFPLFWDVSKQLHFLTDQQNYLYDCHGDHLELSCKLFLFHIKSYVNSA